MWVGQGVSTSDGLTQPAGSLLPRGPSHVLCGDVREITSFMQQTETCVQGQ